MAENIDLTKFSEEELIQLNRRIVERLRSLHQHPRSRSSGARKLRCDRGSGGRSTELKIRR